MNLCPVCSTAEPVITVTRDVLPSMQNYVHRTPESARTVTRGSLSLATCQSCGFSWNASFDPSRLEYDANYDNAAPSAVIDRHYHEAARELGKRHALERGYVVDIGCGKGTFLKALCRVWPECRALGVDPALPHDEVHADGRLTLIKGLFSPGLLQSTPSLVLSRHVLEHMPDPVEFVRGVIRPAIETANGAPLFVEVPDLEWILDQRAFWDFCYEHCNYFTNATLARVLTRAGLRPIRSGVTFGRQHVWMEAVPAHGLTPPADGPVHVPPLCQYAEGEQARVRAIRERLADLRAHGRTVAVWGMATKGIMFSLMVDPESRIIDYTIDVNVNKQGCFVPVTARRIDPPAALRNGKAPAVVVVMNPAYVGEIAATCRSLGVVASFLDASGEELAAG